MRIHELKTCSGPFSSLWDRSKRHEVRRDDRNFQPGDLLVLREHEPSTAIYSGRWIIAEVTYKTNGGEWDLLPWLCVLSVLELLRSAPPRPSDSREGMP